MPTSTEAVTDIITENSTEQADLGEPGTSDSSTSEQKVNMDAVPYVATVYTNPDLDINEDVILKFYATDYYHSAYLNDNYEEEFEIELNLNGEITKLKKNAGESTINLGKRKEGEYWYTIQAIDKYDRKSAEMYGEFRVEDKEKKEEIIRAYTHYVTDSELEEYGISKDDNCEKAHATKTGLQKLINELSDKGIRKCVLPKGTYRIDSEYNDVNGTQTVKNVINIPSNFILDLNGSILKQDTTPHKQSRALMFSIDNAYDAHVTNGIIEGDYGERDLTPLESGNPSGEQVGCGIIAGGSKYSSFDNLVVRKFSGYAMSVGLGINSDHAKSNWKELTDWKSIDIDDNGNEIDSCNKFTSDYNDLSAFEGIDTLRTGKYLGYQFSQDGDDWIVKYHFYDSNKNYLKTIVGHQYRPFVKPENAAYLRVTYISSDVTKLKSLYVYHMYTPVNCVIKDIAFEDTRTCALNPCQGNNILIENCTFSRTATNITPVAIDFEDGWNLMQDYCLRNNEVLVPVGTGDIVVVGGMNLQFENNKNFRFSTRSCTPGIVFRNNEDCSGGIYLTDRLNTGYYRYYNNKNVGYIAGGANENLGYKIYDCTFKETAASANEYTEFIRCEFDWNYKSLQYNTGGIITGNFKDCILKNYIDPEHNYLHAENAYFNNCKIENIRININGDISFKNCEIASLNVNNYTKDINLYIGNSDVYNFNFDFIPWAKANYNIKFENSTFSNKDKKNIFEDAFANYCDTKVFKIESKNNIYVNDTVLANESVLSNSNIDITME